MSSRLAAVESELAELRSSVRELRQLTVSGTSRTESSSRNPPALDPEHEPHRRASGDAAETATDPPVAPIRVIRKMYTWINGDHEGPQDSIDLPEQVKAKLALKGLGSRLIEV